MARLYCDNIASWFRPNAVMDRFIFHYGYIVHIASWITILTLWILPLYGKLASWFRHYGSYHYMAIMHNDSDIMDHTIVAILGHDSDLYALFRYWQYCTMIHSYFSFPFFVFSSSCEQCALNGFSMMNWKMDSIVFIWCRYFRNWENPRITY